MLHNRKRKREDEEEEGETVGEETTVAVVETVARKRKREEEEEEEEEDEETIVETVADWLRKRRQGGRTLWILPTGVFYLHYILLTIPHAAHCLLSKLDMNTLVVFAAGLPSLRANIIHWLQAHIVERCSNGVFLQTLFTRFPDLQYAYSQKDLTMIFERVQETFINAYLGNGLVKFAISAVTNFIGRIVTDIYGGSSGVEINRWKAGQRGKRVAMLNNLRVLQAKSHYFRQFRHFLTGLMNSNNVANTPISMSLTENNYQDYLDYDCPSNRTKENCTTINLLVTFPPAANMRRRRQHGRGEGEDDHRFKLVIHILHEASTPALYNYLEEKLRETYEVAEPPTLDRPKVKVNILFSFSLFSFFLTQNPATLSGMQH